MYFTLYKHFQTSLWHYVLCCLLFFTFCQKFSPAKAALPNCQTQMRLETLRSQEAEARRLLEQNDPQNAAKALQNAACLEETPDTLLADALASAILFELLTLSYRPKEIALLLAQTKGGEEKLLQKVKDAPPAVAAAIYAALAIKNRDQKLAPPLLALKNSAVPKARANALQGLFFLGVLEKKDAKLALQDSDHRIRLVGIEIAAKLAPEFLEMTLTDPVASVRIAMASSLSSLPVEEGALLASLLSTDPNLGVRLAALNMSFQIGLTRDETLSQALEGDEPFLRLAAARAKGAESKEALEILLLLLSQKGPVRRSALLFAGSFHKEAKSVAPLLHEILVKGTQEERVLAAAALLRLEPHLPAGNPSRRARRELKDTLIAICEKEGRPAVRACAELSPRGDSRARFRLRALSRNDNDPLARSAALRALALVRKEFLGDLVSALGDPEPGVRFTAAKAILSLLRAIDRNYGR